MKIFKKQPKTELKEPTISEAPTDTKAKPKSLENPYLNARNNYRDLTGSALWQRRVWQMVALLSLMIVLVAVAGIIKIGSQSKFVPWVVEVDSVGAAVSVGRADRVGDVDQRVIKASVGRFIAQSRLVTPDVALQRAAIFEVFAMLGRADPAAIKMKEWYEQPSPFKRAETQMVSVNIKSILPQNADTWQVDWVEETRSRDGAPAAPSKQMRALVTVYVSAPSPNTPEEVVQKNPLGIFVKNYSWSQIL